MNKYRISKYNPKYRDKKGTFLENDWTSYSDIGKEYFGKILCKEEYLEIEKLYCNCIIYIANIFNIKEFIITDLEKYHNNKYILNLLKELNCQQIFKNIDNELIINIKDLELYLILLLRETFWCNLISINYDFKIEIGYDLYIYVYCDYIPLDVIEHYKEKKLFIEIM